MRAFVVVCLSVFLAIGIGIASLASAGADSTGPVGSMASVSATQAALAADLASVTAQPSVSLVVSLPARSHQAPLQVALALSTNSSASLASTASKANAAVSLARAGTPFLQARVIRPQQLYVRFERSVLTRISAGGPFQPIINALPARLSGHWLLLGSSGAQGRLGLGPNATQGGLGRVLDALATSASIRRIDQHGGTQVVVISGTNQELGHALMQVLASVSALLPVHFQAAGTFSLRASATAGVLQSLTFSDDALRGDVTITHQALAIRAPSGAISVSPAGLLPLGLLPLKTPS